MTTKILFVDDEAKLLSAIERRMSVEYDIVTALSGSQGLDAIREEGPFAVIVTDMRMPIMDGVEFVKNARAIAPDSIYMMLTGNQDQATASRAVNEGHIFRFLNKPCHSEDLKRALNVALRQHKLLTGEKELLHKTFCGAVEVLVDILETPYSTLFTHSAAIREIVEELRVSLGVNDHWEVKLAAKLSLLGFTLMAEADRQRFEQFFSYDSESQELMKQGFHLGGKLIEKIPRLQAVAKIIHGQADLDFEREGLEDPASLKMVDSGRLLLRLALEIDRLASKGITFEDGVREIQKLFTSKSSRLQEAIAYAWPSLEKLPTMEISSKELEVGMVLSSDVTSAGGAVLVRKGRRLTPTIVEKLRYLSKENTRNRTCRIYGSENALKKSTS